MLENADDYDFTPSDNTKLSTLFQNEEFTHNLTYTAPKQPKVGVKTEESTTKTSSSVLSARIVNLWKLENGKYESLGRHGLAIIGSSQHSLFELIIYKEKTNILVRIPLNQHFNLINKKDNFSTFYDLFNDNWLIKFDLTEEQSTFSKDLLKYGVRIEEEHQPEPEKEKTDEFKANILSRMAKMGQQILPETSEESGNLEVEVRLQKKSQEVVKKVQNTEIKEQQQIVVTSPSISNTLTFDPLSFLISQNTELKLNLTQMTNKLDQVLQGLMPTTTKAPSREENCKIKALELRCSNLSSDLQKLSKKHEELLSKKNQEIRNSSIIDQQKNEIEKITLNLNEALNKSQESERTIQELRSEVELLKTEQPYENERGHFVKIREVIKRQMDGLYGTLIETLEEDQDEFKSKIGNVIKRKTYEMLQDLQEVCLSEDSY